MFNRDSNGFVTALTDSDLVRFAPSVFAKDYADSRSEQYAQFNTHDIIEALRGEGYVPTFASQGGKKRSHTKTQHANHMVRFTHIDNLGVDFTDTNGGGYPEIVLGNSHDGTSAFTIDAGFYRLVCANGMVMNMSVNEESSARIRHRGHTLEEVVTAALKSVTAADAIQNDISEWNAITLTKSQQREFARRACALRYKIKNPNTDALLSVRRPEDFTPTLWNVQNVIQENLIRGGVKIGQRLSRPVYNIKKNIDVNKKLWTLTSDFHRELVA